jgi:hypothetical protein
MITKFKFSVVAGKVVRTPDYSFTALEDLSGRLNGVDKETVISAIAASTLKGESERKLIEIEDAWFKVQTGIQDMDAERVTLEKKLVSGDSNGNPLTPIMQQNIAARIAELKEGTITIKKEFYNHYTREKMLVDEVIQTPYTIALETRKDHEKSNPYLAGFRGVGGSPARPSVVLNAAKETEIRKELVRQKIETRIGDDRDLIADMSNALSALIKKVNGQTNSAAETADVAKYVSRQAEIATILSADYVQ